jgi:hypothetical protein
VEVREITFKSAILDSQVRISSWMPSAKYALSGSRLRFLKKRSQVQQSKATVAQQQKQIEALTATVQKVSERVELSASAPRIATNDD